MRREILLKFTSALIGISVLTMFLTPILAAPVQPFNRWGYAYDNGGTPLDTQDIYAWIDGMAYGMNITGTFPEDGLFALNCLADDSIPDNVKTGGYDGDTVFYSHGDLTTNGTFIMESDTWQVGGFNLLPANLTEVANTPALLKINNVCSQSGFPVEDYVGIYNPSAGAVDVRTFSIAVGTAAPMAITAGDIISGFQNPIQPGLTCYIDMAGWGGLSTTGNAITLSQTLTVFIVDRVEYGVIATEPENTIMNNAPNMVAGIEIYRQPSDGSDTNDCLLDFNIGPVVLPFPHTDFEASGPIGSSASTGPFGISYNPDCGCFGTPDIYYSVDFNSTWNFIDQDPDRDGGYLWTAPTPGTYWWIVNGDQGFGPGYNWPLPGVPAEAGPYEITTPKYSFPLLEGWNLISQPLIQSDEDLGVVLNNISGKWDCIQAYESLSPYPWRSNSTFKPDRLNDLKSLNHTIGFWINITEQNVNLTVEGFSPFLTEIPLFAGWNLLGYPSLTQRTVSLAFVGTGYDRPVEGFNATNPYRLGQLADTYLMKPGEGYWIHVPADTTWTINW